MTGVHAALTSGAAKGVTITSDQGVGDDALKTLLLTGNVVVVSPDHKSSLICDRLKYDAGRQVFNATGNVRLKNTVGSIGVFPELISSSDFRKIATPPEFAVP